MIPEYKIYNQKNMGLLATMADNSIDAIVTDCPYGLGKEPDAVETLQSWVTTGYHEIKGKGFMGKEWDAFVPQPIFWKEVFRVLKPGGYVLAFFGTRTYDWGVMAVRLAGFEIRDCIQWIYGSGFPKSLAVDKALDLHEKNTWLDICKLIDNQLNIRIFNTWKDSLKIVKYAEGLLQRSGTEIGTCTQEKGSVQNHVTLSFNQENVLLNAIIAELKCSEALHWSEVFEVTVHENAEVNALQLQSLAKYVEQLLLSHNARQGTITSIVLQLVKVLQSEKIADKHKEEEVLKTWLGKKKSLNEQDINALSVALIEGLKDIILSQSKTFQSLDIALKTECVSAMTVTTTEYMAECLITSMVDMLKSYVLSKQAGAERETIGKNKYAARRPNKEGRSEVGFSKTMGGSDTAILTAAATEAAQTWQGYGTALKPAYEPICVARKPLDGTVANNVLKHECGALNLDECRIEFESENDLKSATWGRGTDILGGNYVGATHTSGFTNIEANSKGRFPANIIFDEEAAKVLDEQSGTLTSGVPAKGNAATTNNIYGEYSERSLNGYGDSGGASRFFYCAKASKEDRNYGCEGLSEKQYSHDGRDKHIENAYQRHDSVAKNNHPTVKPITLMRYLVRLVKSPFDTCTIADFFTGSGTTGIACMLEGINFIGCDDDKNSFNISKARIEYAKNDYLKEQLKPKQAKLFNLPAESVKQLAQSELF